VPPGVVAPTFTVIVDEEPAVTVDGLKPTVVPDGAPLALSDTDCAEPLVTAVEIDDEPLAPWFTLRLAGFAEIEKSLGGGVVMVSDTVVVCVLLVPVPVIVIVNGPPVGVEAATLTVIVDEPPALTELGLNVTVTPVGWPLALSATACAVPLVTAVEIDDAPLDP
jgi:hypothetical protein